MVADKGAQITTGQEASRTGMLPRKECSLNDGRIWLHDVAPPCIVRLGSRSSPCLRLDKAAAHHWQFQFPAELRGSRPLVVLVAVGQDLEERRTSLSNQARRSC